MSFAELKKYGSMDKAFKAGLKKDPDKKSDFDKIINRLCAICKDDPCSCKDNAHWYDGE